MLTEPELNFTILTFDRWNGLQTCGIGLVRVRVFYFHTLTEQ